MKSGDLLLVIDMQNVYTKTGKWACRNTEGAAQNIKKIIDSGMEQVIFTRFLASEQPKGIWCNYNSVNASVNQDTWSNEMLPELAEYVAKYPLYTKSVYSSLAISQLLETARKAKRVIVTGVVAECCVLSTVLALIDAGIYTVYLTDGISGLSKEKEEAVELILSGLEPLHVAMMDTKEYLNELS